MEAPFSNIQNLILQLQTLCSTIKLSYMTNYEVTLFLSSCLPSYWMPIAIDQIHGRYVVDVHVGL
jgi:hypothetical protein